jgi:hypothetical protein
MKASVTIGRVATGKNKQNHNALPLGTVGQMKTSVAIIGRAGAEKQAKA